MKPTDFKEDFSSVGLSSANQCAKGASAYGVINNRNLPMEDCFYPLGAK